MITHRPRPRPGVGKLLAGSVNEKLEQVEQKLIHLGSRASYVIGLAPKIPISNYVDKPEAETGVIFRQLFPSNGTVNIGYMFIEELDTKADVNVTIKLDSQTGGSSIILPITKKSLVINPDIAIEAGQRLTISISPPDSCSKIWSGFVFEISEDQVVKEQKMTEQLVNLLDQADEDLNNA